MSRTINKITSRDNNKLKFARRVREGIEDGAIFVEGVRLVEEAVRSRIKILEVFASNEIGEACRKRELIGEIQQTGADINEVPESLFNSIADTKQPQGIILICQRPETTKVSFEKIVNAAHDKIPSIIFLYKVNNPSNLGAVIRTVEAAGALGVVISKNSADVFSPKALRSAMGSSFRIPIWANADLEGVIECVKKKDMIITAADMNADMDYMDINWKKKRLLIFGSEAAGLPQSLMKDVEQKVKIPIEPSVESLNLAVSCGVILFEAKRQNFI